MKSYLAIVILFVNLSVPEFVRSQYKSSKKIIEFGWDYLSVDEIFQKADEIEKRPFHGTVFSFQRRIMELFDTVAYSEEYFNFPKLRQLPFKKFTDNFFFIRLQSKSGAHWYNDGAWRIILQNTEKLSWAIKVGKVKGCLLDPEYYGENPANNPWQYFPESSPGKSINEVRKQVKARGKQLMEALQKHTDEADFLCLWIAGLMLTDLKNSKFEKTRQTFLPDFFEGMLGARKPGIKLIDGNELSYWYRTPSDFIKETNWLDSSSKSKMNVTPKSNYKLGIAQALYYDGMYGTAARLDKGNNEQQKTQWHENNLHFATAVAEKYIWYYSERINFWEPASLDSEPIRHLTWLFNELNRNSTTPYIAKGRIYQPTPPMQYSEEVFETSYNPKVRSLTIKLFKASNRINVYNNYKLLTSISPKGSLNLNYTIPSSALGSIIVEAMVDQGKTAYSIARW